VNAPGEYELVVTPPAARAISERLPEPAATAVIEFLTTTLIREPRRVGKPIATPLKVRLGDGPAKTRRPTAYSPVDDANGITSALCAPLRSEREADLLVLNAAGWYERIAAQRKPRGEMVL
jgi:hypothetical protein